MEEVKETPMWWIRCLARWRRLKHKFGFHDWIYGGRRADCSDGSYTITGTRRCWRCKRYEYFWFGVGKKSGWYEFTNVQ